jgi:hypothetical protein
VLKINAMCFNGGFDKTVCPTYPLFAIQLINPGIDLHALFAQNKLSKDISAHYQG